MACSDTSCRGNGYHIGEALLIVLFEMLNNQKYCFYNEMKFIFYYFNWISFHMYTVYERETISDAGLLLNGLFIILFYKLVIHRATGFFI